jgi:hypothetical protein
MITRAKLSSVVQGQPKFRSMLAGNAAFNPTSYESIATYTATGSETSFTFSSIPQTYAHLQLRVIARQATGSGTTQEWCTYNLNGSTTGSDYTLHGIQATGSAVQGNWSFTDNGAVNAFYIAGNGLASSIFGVGISDFQDYSSTTRLKTIRNIGGVDANGSGSLFITSALFRQTNAITSIQITGSGSRAWATGSVFSLYGIKGA